jgi:hypothetical protein
MRDKRKAKSCPRGLNHLSRPPKVLLLPIQHPDKKKTNRKQDKKKRPSLHFILPSKKKRVADALAASSSPFVPAGVPSAWCSQRPRL